MITHLKSTPIYNVETRYYHVLEIGYEGDLVIEKRYRGFLVKQVNRAIDYVSSE